MITSYSISKFYEDLASLRLKFPGKELANLGYSKGYVSDVINKKKEPSKDFLNDFYKKFPISSLKSDNMIDQVLPIGDLKVTLKDYFDLLKDQARKAEEREREFLEIIKSKLISIDANSREISEDIEALTIENQAAHRALMDSVDIAAGQPNGTTRAAAGIVELASQDVHLGKDKKSDAGKKTGLGKQG